MTALRIQGNATKGSNLRLVEGSVVKIHKNLRALLFDAQSCMAYEEPKEP